MILERESQMTDSELNNSQYFPKYLLVRRCVEGSSEIEEWQGFVKDLKNTIAKNSKDIKNEMKASQKKRAMLIQDLKSELQELKSGLLEIKNNKVA